jgi:hypothetical protein
MDISVFQQGGALLSASLGPDALCIRTIFSQKFPISAEVN